MADECTDREAGHVPTEDENARSVVEALLIAADVPLGAGKLASVLGRHVEAREVRMYVDALNEEYAETGRSFRITEIAGGFQLMVHPEFAPWIRQLMKEKAPPRLSPASLETLAILAFKQPIAKAEVEHIRGVAVDGVLRQLMEKGLVRISGRSDAPGRPLLYGTTRDFLKHFGLKTLSDLPKVRELEELLQEEAQRSGTPMDPLTGEEDAVEREDALHTARTNGNDDGEFDFDSDGTGASEPVSGTGGGGFPPPQRPVDSSGPG